MTRPRSLAAAAAAALLTLTALGVTTTPASAHDQLLASSPAEGAVLADAPAAVVLDFSDRVLDLGGIVVVADRDGRNWADGALSLSLNRVTQRLKPGAPAGAYQIRWQVVSADGHPISDVVDYSVGEKAAPIAPGGSRPTETPAPRADDAGMPSWLPVAGLGLGGAAVGVGAYALIAILIRRRRETAA